MTDELKPVRCGCGGEVKVSTWTGTMATTINDCNVVYCETCGMQTKRFKTEAEAITAWNRAMGEQAPLAKVNEIATRSYCGECGERLDDYDDICGEPPIKYCPMCVARLEWK